jgi:uncharacterized protein (DUF433 family)
VGIEGLAGSSEIYWLSLCAKLRANARVIATTPEEAAMFERITFAQEIMGGRACIRGMRITVAVIVGQVAHGASFEEILEGYPDLEREDVEQAVEYAAWLTQEEIYNV